MSTKILLGICIAIQCMAASAEENHPDRMQRFAALPDWAGIWEGQVASEMRTDEFGKVMHAAATHPRSIPTVAPPGVLSPQEAFVISRTQLHQVPPYNEEWRRKYQRRAANIRATPASAVKPGSIMACEWDFPELMDNPFDTLFQIYITPEETLLLFVNGQARHIYTDRSHPGANDLWPTGLGNSVGQWEGDTLKIDTIERRAGPFVQIPHVLSPDLSEQARYTESIRLVDHDTLQDDMVIEDPERLTRPWALSLTFRRVKDLDRMIPTDCTENNRFGVVGGRYTITPRH